MKRTVRYLVLVAACSLAPVAWAAVPLGAQRGNPVCADFDAYEWAQSVHDEDPDESGSLDPDGDGIACPELPSGAALALFADEIPEDATEMALVRVIDGDTIEVETENGDIEDVRLILADTPESVDPNRPDQCFGAEATAFTAFLLSLSDGTVHLERDVSDRDRYGRLLRYAWLDISGEPYLLNEALVRSGYAALSTYPPNVKYADKVRAAQAFAREYGLGLWSACGGADVPLAEARPVGAVAGEEPPPILVPISPPGGQTGRTSNPGGETPTPTADRVTPTPGRDVTPTPTVELVTPTPPLPPDIPTPPPPPPDVPTPPPPPDATCDPAYPSLCIPPFPPDLNCDYVYTLGANSITVLPPDPHGFDGNDNDGLGCEG